MCPTSVGFEAGPREPKKTTSAARRLGLATRAARGTSPLIAYVVLPLSAVARRGAPVYGSSLYTRQTSPEQSKPPGRSLPPSCCGRSDVPAHTYGEPTSRRARASTACCQLSSAG